MNPIASIVFVTYNRKDLLCQAIDAAKAQTVFCEIIVMDDASNDGTDNLIRLEYPDIIYCRSEKNLGPSYQRNEGAKKSKSDIIIFLDDDAVLQSNDTVEITISEFNREDIGVIAIPFINILQGSKVSASAPDKGKTYLLHAFVAAAFAAKRDIFLELGGFREEYFYMGEEGDFCIRLLQAGYYVKCGSCTPVYHYQPPKRVSFRADYYGRRNDILFIYLNAPRKLVMPFVLATFVKGILFGIKERRIKNMMKGVMSGLKLILNSRIKNLVNPVSPLVFRKYRHFKKNEPLELDW